MIHASPHPHDHPTCQRSRLVEQARAYLETYHSELGRPATELAARRKQVEQEVLETGAYTHTPDELTYGAQLAWRNHARCIGRLYWRSLRVRDCRNVHTLNEAAACLDQHLRFAFNNGDIRSTISVFAPGIGSIPPILIENPQLIRYAGYRLDEGTVLGDPLNTAFTQQALDLGWNPKRRSRFDILPVILRKGNDLLCHPLPEDCRREVHLEHPLLPRFKDLGLRWHALPVISNMILEIGGIEYPCAPFNGFYMGTEIGCRNLADENRYHLLPEIADLMGLDRTDNISLWKDRALLELNVAVLHSFRKQGVRITDHHEASDHFMRHMVREQERHRPVPADWSWIVPPTAASTTKVFHTPMTDFDASPRFVHRQAHPAPHLCPMNPRP